jgi:hypothetical protein
MRWTAIPFLLFAVAEAGAQERFKTPTEAVAALRRAAQSDDTMALARILGPNAGELISSGDPVGDRASRQRFANAAASGTWLETLDTGELVVHAGKENWPLPMPLAKDARGWYFQTEEGKQELLNRRIGRNELLAVQTARVYVDAQREYRDRMGAYAQKLRSDPGTRDGLYWEGGGSPLGPLVAEATSAGYSPTGNPPTPYHGYFFRVLTVQGPAGPEGARNYIKDGKMTGGFALVAYPATLGVSGVMTFIVGPTGIVYQKRLSDDEAKTMTDFNPDDSWTPVRD